MKIHEYQSKKLLSEFGIPVPESKVSDDKNTLLNHEPSKREKILFYRSREIYAVRYKQYKAHFITQGAYNYPPGSNKKIILKKPLIYNLNVDPSEKYNIAEKNPEILKKIKNIIFKHKKNLNAP